MGCDIHCFIDLELPNGNVLSVNQLLGYDRDLQGEHDIMRNYLLFSVLAGVRDSSGGGNMLVPPRGHPPKWSEPAELYLKDDWLHTPSWLTLAECRQVAARYEDLARDTGRTRTAEDFIKVITLMEQFETAHCGTCRFIFAFDN